MLRGFGLSAVTVVDVRPADDFKAGHLPLSVTVPASTLRSNLQSPDALATLLRQAGLDLTHEAVLVSEGGLNRESALALWMLERAGQRRVSLFLGHVDRWAELGLELVRATPADPAAGQPTPVLPGARG